MCHQTVSLIARYLEEHNLPTVIMGCAKDIVEQAGVPRFYWSNFPLGHSAGKPQEPESQQATLAGALNLFVSASVARTTATNPQRWAADTDWQQDFMNVDTMPAAKLAQLREEFAEQKRVANAKRADVGA